MADLPLCRLDALEDPGTRGFTLDTPDDTLELFLVRRRGLVRAYRNSCPHTGVPLNWQPDVFLDASGELVQCALHGALFLPDTGECIHGPCLGQFLDPLPVRVEAGEVVLMLEGG